MTGTERPVAAWDLCDECEMMVDAGDLEPFAGRLLCEECFDEAEFFAGRPPDIGPVEDVPLGPTGAEALK